MISWPTILGATTYIVCSGRIQGFSSGEILIK